MGEKLQTALRMLYLCGRKQTHPLPLPLWRGVDSAAELDTPLP